MCAHIISLRTTFQLKEGVSNMPEAMGNISWSTYALVIAAVILGVVLISFPEITRGIMTFLNSMVSTAGGKITDTLAKSSAS